MSSKSSIEWTSTVQPDGTVTPGATWNPVLGCTRVSAGCDRCYAIRQSHRMAGNPNAKISAANEGLTRIRGDGLDWTGAVRCLPERLTVPMHWKKPRKIFVNSLSDLFHHSVPFEFIDKVFAVMALCPQHTFQILSKRPERMSEYFDDDANESPLDERLSAASGDMLDGEWIWNEGKRFRPAIERNIERFLGLDSEGNIDYETPDILPPPNVWLGTSVENQAAADERIPHLLQVPAAVRFLSAEPLLGGIDLVLNRYTDGNGRLTEVDQDVLRGVQRHYASGVSFDSELAGKIHLVIAGGESGPGARPCHPDWLRSLRDQCQAAGVAYFFKQHGNYEYMGDGDGWSYDLYTQFEANELPSMTSGVMLVSESGELVKPEPSRKWWKAFSERPDADTFAVMHNVGKKIAGRLLDGVEWNEMPEVTK